MDGINLKIYLFEYFNPSDTLVQNLSIPVKSLNSPSFSSGFHHSGSGISPRFRWQFTLGYTFGGRESNGRRSAPNRGEYPAFSVANTINQPARVVVHPPRSISLPFALSRLSSTARCPGAVSRGALLVSSFCVGLPSVLGRGSK